MPPNTALHACISMLRTRAQRTYSRTPTNESDDGDTRTEDDQVASKDIKIRPYTPRLQHEMGTYLGKGNARTVTLKRFVMLSSMFVQQVSSLEEFNRAPRKHEPWNPQTQAHRHLLETARPSPRQLLAATKPGKEIDLGAKFRSSPKRTCQGVGDRKGQVRDLQLTPFLKHPEIQRKKRLNPISQQ